MGIGNRSRLVMGRALGLLLITATVAWARDGASLSLVGPPLADEAKFVLTDSDEEGQEHQPVEFLLVQTQPPAPLEAQPQSPQTPTPVRRRRNTYQLPPMFGDNFGSTTAQLTGVPGTGVNFPGRTVANVPLGSAVGREKIAENNSPEPRSRLLWNYNYYDDVIGGIGHVNRNSVGIEHPFGDGTYSLEVRFPFADTLDTDQIATAPAARNTEVGDVTAILKTLLWESDQFLISLGIGVTAPTAQDSRVFDPGNTQAFQLQHQSVQMLPFLGWMHGLDSGWFWQGFTQLAFSLNGDPVLVGPPGAANQVGVLQDQTVLFVDVGVGRWLLGSPYDPGPAVAATVELHYAGSLQDADAIDLNEFVLTSDFNRFDTVNLTLGLHIAVSRYLSIRPGFATPLNDDQFDSEAMLQINIWR